MVETEVLQLLHEQEIVVVRLEAAVVQMDFMQVVRAVSAVLIRR